MDSSSFIWWAFRFLQENWYLPVLFFCSLAFYITAPLASKEGEHDYESGQGISAYDAKCWPKAVRWVKFNVLSNWAISRISFFVGAICLAAFPFIGEREPVPLLVLNEEKFLKRFGPEGEENPALWRIEMESEIAGDVGEETIFYTVKVSSTKDLFPGFVLFPIAVTDSGDVLPQPSGHIVSMEEDKGLPGGWVGYAKKIDDESDGRLSITTESDYPIRLAYFLHRQEDLTQALENRAELQLPLDNPRTTWCVLVNNGDILRCPRLSP